MKLGDLIVEKVDDRTSPLAEGRELKLEDGGEQGERLSCRPSRRGVN